MPGCPMEARMTEKNNLPEEKNEINEMTRRSFIEKAAVSGAAFTILPGTFWDAALPRLATC